MEETPPPRWTGGKSWFLLLFFAALAIPRAVGHDMRSLNDPVVNAFLAIAPYAVWVWYVVWKKVPNTFNVLITIGLLYGIMLAVTHQITWNTFWGDHPPRLRGSFADTLPLNVESWVLRSVAFMSSVLTGLLTGAILGTIASYLRRRKPEITEGNF